MHPSQPDARPTFARDRFTWTSYLLLGYFAYLQSIQGPLMPFLRQELGLSYVVGSLHLSANAAGMVLVGLLGERLLRRLGARLALWGGAVGMLLAALALGLGAQPAATIAATAAMGVIGTLLLVAQQATLGEHQREARAVAFTEANIAASVCSMLAPLAVGGAVAAGLGWRAALLAPLPLLAALLLREGRRPVPEPAHASAEGAGQRLPGRFWAIWASATLGVAAEWSIGFWGADYLHTVGGLPIELAVTALSGFFIAMLAGRIIGSRLARRFAALPLLIGAQLIAIAGVVLLWQSPSAALSIAALVVSGLGISNLYPLALSAAVEAAPQQVSAVSARMTMAGGLAIFSAPLALGGWADAFGLRGAFGIVPLFLAAALATLLVARARRAGSSRSG